MVNVSDHYWWDGSVISIWGSGEAGVGNCPAIYVTGDAGSVGSLDVRVTVFSCDQDQRFICEGPEYTSCGGKSLSGVSRGMFPLNEFVIHVGSKGY